MPAERARGPGLFAIVGVRRVGVGLWSYEGDLVYLLRCVGGHEVAACRTRRYHGDVGVFHDQVPELCQAVGVNPPSPTAEGVAVDGGDLQHYVPIIARAFSATSSAAATAQNAANRNFRADDRPPVHDESASA
jgi:hypothetical protein